MHRRHRGLARAACAVAALAGAVAWVARPAAAAVVFVPVPAVFEVSDANGDGAGDGIVNASPGLGVALVGVGERETLAGDQLVRAVLKFDLPDPPTGEVWTDASLEVFLLDRLNTGTLTTSLYHAADDNALTATAGLYEDARYVDTGIDVAGPSSPTGGFTLHDVTDLVLADAADGVSAFRLQVDGIALDNDGISREFHFATSPSASFQLALTSAVPEPATAGLVAAALAGGLASRAKRRRA